MLDKLSIFFWNTSLSPPKNGSWGKASDDKLLAVAELLNQLIFENYDFICLCEVAPNDIEFLNKKLNLFSRGYSFIDGSKNESGVIHDTSIIYKMNFNFIHIYSKIDGKKKKRIKAFTRYMFQNSINDEQYCFYLAHWPSKLRDNREKQRSIASYIRSDLSSLEEINASLKFIVLGDFNSEPYEPAMLSGLRSSRHQSFVLDDPYLLYNPFWVFLPCYNNSPKGSYYYEDGDHNYWSIIDQILFSGNFLEEEWKIRDENIDIINVEKYMKSKGVVQYKNPSDHLPVYAKIEK